MTQLSDVIQQAMLGIQGIPFSCQLALNLFMCNFAFFPCNMTIGTPKPICSKSCFYFHQNCPLQYDLVHTIAGFPFMDDCNNTLTHLEQWYDIEIHSDDFKDSCLDFGLESEYIIQTLIIIVLYLVYACTIVVIISHYPMYLICN